MAKAIIPYKPIYTRTKRAAELTPLFSEWDQILRWAGPILAHANDPDHPYWYSERTQMGWLAQACYELGWPPLQEPSVYRAKRVRLRGKIKVRQVAGRSDLWVYRGRGQSLRVYDFEAKADDLSLSGLLRETDFKLPSRTVKMFKKAAKQINLKHSHYKADMGVVLVFLRLYLPKSQDFKNVKLALKRLKSELSKGSGMEEIGADFCGLHLSSEAIVKKVALATKQSNYDVGVAVLGKIEYA